MEKLLLFAVPIFGANLLQALYGTVDLFVVGLFADASAVSAVSTGSMMMQTITGIITGLTMGCTVLLGQNIGKKDEAAAERTVGSALWLFVTVGILLAVIVAVLAVGIASVINAPAEAFPRRPIISVSAESVSSVSSCLTQSVECSADWGMREHR